MKTYWWHEASDSYFECETDEDIEAAVANDAVEISEEAYLRGCVLQCGL